MSQSYQQAASNKTLTCYVGQTNIVGIKHVTPMQYSTRGGYCRVRIKEVNRECVLWYYYYLISKQIKKN